MTTLPHDYEKRVYAGVLGKIIGVYLGRPFEQWSHERIMAELGEIRGYVHERLDFPLIVSDDDISGTFTFFRALTDRGCPPGLTAAQIGETWLNYIIENKTILWWGGIGLSTEHTAWCRLANGISAPESGSMSLNGATVAEQIGSQIFIDAWGLANPGDPERAADFARRAASVSHDGLAIHGAQVVAAMVAAAFVEPDMDRLISLALDQIPEDSLIRKMAGDIRDWHASHPRDWRRTLAKIQETYGYSRYGGGCHIVPNHALIHLALRHSGGDFHEAQMIVNTAGWDTDCNAGNVGCILGVTGGLAGLDGGPDWRGPVADRMLLPTAEGGAAITDALRESFSITNAARKLRGIEPVSPKQGARFHFSLPGSVQGFLSENPATLRLENPDGALACRILDPGGILRAFTATFTPKENFSAGSYAMSACPTLHPGQTVEARWVSPATNPTPIAVRLILKAYDQDLNLQSVEGPEIVLDPGSGGNIFWAIPDTDGFPIAEIGFEILPGGVGVPPVCVVGSTANISPKTGGTPVPSVPETLCKGTLLLDSLDWSGAPTTSLMPSKSGNVWAHAWVRTMEGCAAYDNNTTITMHHSRPGGFLLQGSRDWCDYSFRARVEIRLAESFALVIRAQGLRRHYSLRIDPGGRARIVKACDGEETLAEAACPWVLGRPRDFQISARGDLIRASVDGVLLLEAHDSSLAGGAGGFLLDLGGIIVQSADVEALP
ncbi:MAG: ADP-ribosylglycohydrolase family protein [Verrucomicrobiota bacterium]